jgi:hypothetical protein
MRYWGPVCESAGTEAYQVAGDANHGRVPVEMPSAVKDNGSAEIQAAMGGAQPGKLPYRR